MRSSVNKNVRVHFKNRIYVTLPIILKSKQKVLVCLIY